MKLSKLLLLLGIALAITAYFLLGLDQILSIENFQARQEELRDWYAAHRWQAIGLYFALYVLVTGLSLPGAALMTLAGAALFGLVTCTIVVSFASTIGATLAFLVSRYLLRDTLQARFGQRLEAINEGIRRDGAYYLFTLRLIPLFPFFIINLLMGLTPMRIGQYFIISQIGMLPGTLVYVNAGTQLGQLDSLGGILSTPIILSFILLGLFPLLARRLVGWLNARRVYRPYTKPRHFDRNLVVIGAGSGGLVSAYIAAAVRAEVSLIEKDRMGGDCLNRGCVPSKSLIRAARFAAEARQATELGFQPTRIHFHFADIMERVQATIRRIEPHDSVERYGSLGVECIQGEARITSPWTVETNGNTLSTRNIIIATGSQPTLPPIPGIRDSGYLTSDTIWDLREQPRRLLVLGGGTIGCELAQSFARLGSTVSIVQRSERMLRGEDPEFSSMVMQRLKEEGVQLLPRHKPVRFKDRTLVCEHNGQETSIRYDALLVATGRTPSTQGFGLEDLGIPLTGRGTIEVNDYLQTNYPNIYAVGDVAGPYQFTHTAAHQAWYAAVNALFGGLRKFRVDYSAIPWVTFTEPEIARVGLNEQDAKAGGIAYEITRFDISELDRAIVDNTAHGQVKILTVPGRDRILGVTIGGPQAGELLAEFVTAMRFNLGLNKILGTLHAYPTLMEANRYAAGTWKRAHAPERLLRWAARYHGWRRG